MNFVTPTPIQAATIPVALSGRDVCGCAATGTGKTAAYMLPTLERLLYRPIDGIAVTRSVHIVYLEVIRFNDWVLFAQHFRVKR